MIQLIQYIFSCHYVCTLCQVRVYGVNPDLVSVSNVLLRGIWCPNLYTKRPCTLLSPVFTPPCVHLPLLIHSKSINMIKSHLYYEGYHKCFSLMYVSFLIHSISAFLIIAHRLILTLFHGYFVLIILSSPFNWIGKPLKTNLQSISFEIIGAEQILDILILLAIDKYGNSQPKINPKIYFINSLTS